MFIDNYNPKTDISSIGVSIAKANPTLTAQPTMADAANLVYNGYPRALITAAATYTGGTTSSYMISDTEPAVDNAGWVGGASISSDDLKRTNAGTYKVWTRITGDANHNDYVWPTPLEVTIAKADGSVTLSESSYKFTASEAVDATHSFTVTGNSSGGTLSVSSASASVTTSISGTTVTLTRKDASSVTSNIVITVTSAATSNYNAASATYNVTMDATLKSLNLSNPFTEQIIGNDGKNYYYDDKPTGVTPVAVICYVNGSHGLALAMTDEGKMNWTAADAACAAHTPAFSNGTWGLPSQQDWQNILSGIGSLYNVFSGSGGEDMILSYYWSSTSAGDNSYYCQIGDSTNSASSYTNEENTRACLAW